MNTYQHFIGIDVSKQVLDIALVENNQLIATFQIDNRPKAIRQLLQALKKQRVSIKNAIFCAEHTGIYTQHLLQELHKASCPIWLENATHIQLSLGLQRGKNDQLDAKRIALFAYKNREDIKLWTPTRLIISQLEKLLTLRQRLLTIRAQLQVPIQEEKKFSDKATYQLLSKHSQSTLTGVEKDLASVEADIQAIIQGDERLNELFNRITRIEGVGKITAQELLVSTNEFKDFSSSKSFACYCGIAPFEHRSGSSVRGRSRVSHRANKHMKKILHLAAMGAVRAKGKFKTYYERKVIEGKNKMLVLNNVRNKLVHTIFAVVFKATEYDKNFSFPVV